MNSTRWLAAGLIAVSLIAGTFSDSVRRNPALVLGGYRVLSADFHVHSFPLSWATLAPWDTVLEAQRHCLDAIAITGHNHVWVAKIGSWFSHLIGGPTVLVGEEIVAPTYHLLAIGIDHTIDWKQPAAAAIEEVHRQGGVAIAAHPLFEYWAAFDANAMSKLDSAEVLHPLAYVRPAAYVQFQQFYARARLTAIGDSDYHGLGPLGMCPARRTHRSLRSRRPKLRRSRFDSSGWTRLAIRGAPIRRTTREYSRDPEQGQRDGRTLRSGLVRLRSVFIRENPWPGFSPHPTCRFVSSPIPTKIHLDTFHWSDERFGLLFTHRSSDRPRLGDPPPARPTLPAQVWGFVATRSINTSYIAGCCRRFCSWECAVSDMAN
jgi:predicted metal-dependent phosphoesterase TrpH